MRVQTKHLWHNVILHHFTDDDWKVNFKSTRQSFIIFSNNNIGLFRVSCVIFTSLHVQNLSISVFNPINCLHVLSKGLEKVYPTPLMCHPCRRISVGETALVCWCWPLMTASTWQGMENLLPFWNQTKKPVSWSTTSTARATSGYDLLLYIHMLYQMFRIFILKAFKLN